MKTTSSRARALGDALRRGISKGILCALLATTAFCGLTAEPAAAQTAPPAYRNFDSNGVDLVRGDYLLTFTEGSIGSGEAELALVRTVGSAAGGPSQWDGIDLRLTRAFAGGPATVTVTRANRSERFTESGGAFSSSLAIGSALAGGGGNFTYTLRDGTTIGFSDPSGNPMSGTTNFCKDSLQTSCSLLPTGISTPDGRTLTLDWTLNERCAGTFNPDGSLDCEYDWRLGSVANDFGHSIAFAYASGPPGGQPPASWRQRTGASFNAGTASVGYSYPSSGVTEVTDMGGRVWRVSAGAIRRPGAASDTIVVTTNSGGTVSSVANEGVTTSYARSVSGNVVTMAVTDALSQATTIVSDLALSRPTSITDPLGHATAYQYDTAGRLTRVTAHEGNYVQYSLDSRGNVTQTERVAKSGSGATIVTSAVYPSSCGSNAACNQPTSTTDERGQVTDYDWDPTYGVLNSATLPAPGSVRPQTRFAYTLDSASGRYQLTGVSQCRTGAAPACVGTSDEVKSSIAYYADGTIASTSSGDGAGALAATAAMTYDALGDLATVDGPLSGAADTVHYRYNMARELIGAVSPDPDGGGALKPRAVRNTYTNGLLTKVEQGNVDSPSDTDWAAFAPAQAVETGYDANARPVTRKLVSGSTVFALTQASYDALGRTQCVAQRMNPAEFGSLPSDACTLDTQGTGSNDFGPDRIVKTSYDSAGRVAQVKTAFGAADSADVTTSTYTDNGLLATLTDGENNKTTYEYDGHDRLLNTRYPLPIQGANASAPTSGAGADFEQLGYESLAGGTRTSNLAISFRNRAGETIGFGHDSLGRTTSKDLPGGEPDATYSYDLLGRMLSATQNGTTVAFTWDALGRQLTQTLPIASVANPVFTSDYDLAGRRTRLTWPVDASGPTAYHVDYDYLVTGEVVKIREKGATSGAGVLATYGYDDLGRRSSIVRGNGASTGYQYDDVSRLSQLSHDFAGTAHDLILDFAYNPASQIVGRTASNSAYAWTGHGSGSTASTADGLNRLAGHGGATPTYDARGNITYDGTFSYAYSSENLLTSFSTSGPLEYDPLMRFYRNYSTYFIHDGPTGQFLGEYYNGNIVGRYVPGPDTDEALAVIDKFGARTWLHADERGSVIASSGATGANSRIVQFDEYGKRGSGGSMRFAYTGQFHLLGDVYDYKNRNYNARLGRFLQADPIGYGGGMNQYIYVGGDPVNFTDPLGLDATIVVTAFGMLGGSGRGDVFGQVGSTGSTSEAELQRRIEENSRKGPVEEAVDDIVIIAIRVKNQAHGQLLNGQWLVNRAKRKAKNFLESALDWVRDQAFPPLCGCLEAGTPVATPQGLKPIEEIKVGDLVLSLNETTGEIAPKPVTDLIRPEPKPLYALRLTDASGEIETFHATDDHPWKIASKGWVETADLKPGDRVNTSSNADMVVTSLTLTGLVEKTYNLTIADWHTFLVGEDEAIVHNACEPRALSPNQMNRAILTGTAPKGITRVDVGRVKFEETHVHVNGGALNKSGTWKHAPTSGLTNQQAQWLADNGWIIPNDAE